MEIDLPGLCNVDPGHLETFAFLQMLNRVQNSVVFCFRADQMLSARCATASKPKDRKIIRFRPAAGKNQLVRFRAEQIRESIARIINRGARLSSSSMNARGIAKFPFEKR